MDVASSFVGIGLRVGTGFSTAPKAGGFGLSAEVSAAAILGQRSDDLLVSIDSSSGGPPNFTTGDSNSSSQTVMNLDGKVSIDYYFSGKAKLSLGYQARQFWNVDAFSDDENPASQPRLMDGAFIGFTTTF